MRGYGDSDKPSGASNYAADLLVDDIKGIVTELGKLIHKLQINTAFNLILPKSRSKDLRRRSLIQLEIMSLFICSGRKTFILVAHDWGSVVSWIFVDKYPEMLEKYILMNGAHPKVFQMMMKDGNQSSKSWYEHEFLKCVLQ